MSRWRWLSICFWTLSCAGATATSPTPNDGATKEEALLSEPTRSVPLERPLKRVPIAPGDPEQGRFALANASEGVVGEGVLTAEFHTSMGQIDCELFEDRAPITVANFVGLARGVRAWRKEGKWAREPFFDGTTFHRVVPGFVIQAGSRPGTLDGGPGYVIPDEVWQGARHDQAGLLCMANDGPNTGGSQFFILAGERASQLDGSFTIFGVCFQTDVVDRISRVKAFGEKPAEPVGLDRVVIVRAPRW
jgi:peptidyl-prolyl cis-trans isomerase A (cyclophilin A)